MQASVTTWVMVGYGKLGDDETHNFRRGAAIRVSDFPFPPKLMAQAQEK